MKRILAFALACLSAAMAHATTTVTGNLKTLNGTAQSSRSFVRFRLAGCGGNQPRIISTAVLAPSGQGADWHIDFTPDASGAISGTLYSTRDATGLLGGEIDCGGSTTSVWYFMSIWVNGKAGPEVSVQALNGVTLNINSVVPITQNPVVTAPSGDTTYARLDGSNAGFTGNITHNGHDDTGIGTVGAVTGAFSGALSAGAVTATSINNVQNCAQAASTAACQTAAGT